jgi:membrane protease YdiL (CAAX protease family)
VTVATLFTVGVAERGYWRLGLFVAPRLAAREAALGAGAAAAIILSTDALILLSTKLRHVAGSGFPWPELATVYLPAVFHEELLFRGYPFQKMRQWNRGAAIALTAGVFAFVHRVNHFVTPLALTNLFLAGVLLCLAYERYGRLWFPIGIHFGWNILSGPILGYDVSGYVSAASVWRIAGAGPPWLTGGAFGIEGSVWIGVVEVAAIGCLNMMARPRRYGVSEDTE